MIINEAKATPSTANYNFNVYAKMSDDEARTRLSLMTNLDLKNVLKAVPIYDSRERVKFSNRQKQIDAIMKYVDALRKE